MRREKKKGVLFEFLVNCGLKLKCLNARKKLKLIVEMQNKMHSPTPGPGVQLFFSWGIIHKIE